MANESAKEFYKKYVERISQMRDEGMTFREIGEHFGVSRQSVCEIYYKHTKAVKGMRGNGFKIDTIVYKGIYEHFKDNLSETITSFSKKIYGYSSNKECLVRKFLIGEHQSIFKISQIKKMCEITGKTFEELFEER